MTELKSYYFEDLAVGMDASISKTVTEDAIQLFASVSGDINPIHLDEVYAEKTRFKRRIAHGILGASYISAVFGTKFPGPGCIYVSQTLNFKAPVFIGDELCASVRITELIAEKNRALFATTCSVGEKVVLEGQAVIYVPSRPVSG